MRLLNSVWDSTQSYLGVVLAYTSDVDWMTVGAFVLLVARLAQDVPKGVEALQKMFKREEPDDKGDGKGAL